MNDQFTPETPEEEAAREAATNAAKVQYKDENLTVYEIPAADPCDYADLQNWA